eukprot:m.239722 g.239722  ORF g.239722 m.239722 type:complete len:381 (-) comp22786_c0_seq1:27-1169(-)
MAQMEETPSNHHSEGLLEVEMQEHIAHFKEHGYVVIEDVFAPEEILAMRTGLHADLAALGVDHEAILSGEQPPPPGVRGKGPAANIFYSEWKLRATLDDRVHSLFKTILNATFSSGNEPGFEHPLGSSTDVVPFIDHVCYRLPDAIRAEGGLDLHIDRNPHTPYAVHRFRPIQGFISLVDHFGGDSGGLRVVPRFHTQYDQYFAALRPADQGESSLDARATAVAAAASLSGAVSTSTPTPTSTQSTPTTSTANTESQSGPDSSTVSTQFNGEFFRMGSKQHARWHRLAVPLCVPAGAVVLWDNRLPHQTSTLLAGHDTREVIYISYLPAVPLNISYARAQWHHYSRGLRPPIYCEPCDLDQTCPCPALAPDVPIHRLRVL